MIKCDKIRRNECFGGFDMKQNASVLCYTQAVFVVDVGRSVVTTRILLLTILRTLMPFYIGL